MTRFEAWLKSARAGQEFVYSEGIGLFENSQIYAVRRAYDAGLVDLFQRRTVQPKNRDVLSEEGVGKMAYVARLRANPERREPREWRTRPLGEARKAA